MTVNPLDPASVARQKSQMRLAREKYRNTHHDQILAKMRDKYARANPHTPNFNYAYRGRGRKVKHCLFCKKIVTRDSDYCCHEHYIAEFNKIYCGGRKATP